MQEDATPAARALIDGTGAVLALWCGVHGKLRGSEIAGGEI